MTCYIGVDLGTSGCRAVAIDEQENQIAEHRVALPSPDRIGSGSEQDPEVWWQGLVAAVRGLTTQVDSTRVAALAVDGTSGTLLLADTTGHPLTRALMYDDARARAEAKRIAEVASDDTPAGSPTSGLAKLLFLVQGVGPDQDFTALHQADWITGRLTGRIGVSDVNNVLKLGYDAVEDHWPVWLSELGVQASWLPEVVLPGAPIGTVAPGIARELGLTPDTLVVAGTTDSTASVVAAGAKVPGDAVTVLGSTLVVKVVTTEPINAPGYGVYSHRFGSLWLTGGASNSGGGVLAEHFSREELEQLESDLRPELPTGLDYYPLSRPGERFPVNDPHLLPRLSPRPGSRTLFLQGLLEGIAAIEAAAYRRLAELGCPYPKRVMTIGGGAHNEAWRRIRENRLGVPVVSAEHDEAAYGTACIARRGYAAVAGTPPCR